MREISSEIFQAVIRQLSPDNLHPDDRNRVCQAIFFFEDAVKSQYFEQAVLTFNNSPDGFNKRYNLGLNNYGIYLKIINAIEDNGNIERFKADLFLNIILGRSKDETIGFVENYSPVIHTYSDFLITLSKARLAAHFAHEWTHTLGFGHPPTSETNYNYLLRTVPYAIEKIVYSYLENRFSDLLIT